jgi:hypothetical protein
MLNAKEIGSLLIIAIAVLIMIWGQFGEEE